MTESCLLLLASLAAGEAPVALMGPEAYQAVVWTMRNRMEQWGWPCERLPTAYFGWRKPTEGEVLLTAAVFRARDDPTDGGLWALSGEDRRRWRFRPGDMIFRAHGFELHIYQESPWNGSARRSSGS